MQASPSIAARRIGIALALLAALATPAAALEFNLVEQPNGRTMLDAHGAIVHGDFHRFLKFLDTMVKVQRLALLVLDSPGGFVDEAEKMAVTIRNIGLPVAIASGGHCASACVLMFAAAPRRLAAAGARIGVHRASFVGEETGKTRGATDGMALYFEVYGVPKTIIEKMRGTAPGGVTWLTPEDLTAMQVEIYQIPAPSRQPRTATRE